jgi:hypothetical protein
MSQLNWNSESFVPTEQERMRIGDPITTSVNKSRKDQGNNNSTGAVFNK